MDDETLRKKISLIRWVAIIALIASFVSYLFPYFSAAAFGVGVQISGINMISLAFGALPGTSFGDTLSILLYIAPLVFGVVAGIALWAYYYRACAVFSFLAGGLRVAVHVILPIYSASASYSVQLDLLSMQFGFGWWLGMFGIFICAGAALWISRQW
mgnify:CR=1 FL=1